VNPPGAAGTVAPLPASPTAAPTPRNSPGSGAWRGILLVGLAILVAVLFLLQLMIGAAAVPLDEVWAILLGREPGREVWGTIVRELRLPRALTAILAGAALGAAGLQMQTLFRNPLADPWILGIVAGARMGVAVLLVVGGWWVSTGGSAGVVNSVGIAGAGVAGASLALLGLAAAARRVSILTLLILGLMFDFFARGLISVLLHFTGDAQLAAFRAWDDGNFNGVDWGQLTVLMPAVMVGLGLAVALLRSLNGLLLGERYAASAGIAVAPIRALVLFSTALLAGVVTAFCGPIAFLGVAVPHLCRGLFRSSDHRVLLPAVVLMGAALAQSGDLVTNLPWDRHFLHLNAVNFLIGAPVVTWVVLRSRALSGAAG